MKHKTNTRKGFTLVEMLGVLAIIAILISVIAVGVMSAINRARIVATVANFKNLETAVVGFVALPNSAGTVPLTKASTNTASPIRLWNGTGVTQGPNTGNSYTLDQALRASGLIDRPLSWRVGNDGATKLPLANERLFMISRNAWATTGVTSVNGALVSAAIGNPWVGATTAASYNHCEVAEVNAVANYAASATVADLIHADGVNFYLDGTSPLNASRVAYVVMYNVSIKDAKKLSSELNGTLDDSEVQDAQVRGRLIYHATATDVTTTVYYYLASF